LKRIAVILLLLVHLFNIGGYVLLSQYFIYRSDEQIVKQIYDNKVNTDKLVEIKIPVRLPGVSDWADYEEIDGQIQYNGNDYHYVRLKMKHDTMSMLCIPDEIKTRLTKANITIAKQLNDVPSSAKKEHEATAKKGVTDQEINFCFSGLSAPASYKISLLRNTMQKVFFHTHPYIESPGKPPNAPAVRAV
jgi:hypothetical protein